MVASLGDLGPAMKRLRLYDTPQSESTDRISELPTELGTLTELEMLVLQNNAITSVPTELGALTGLRYLDLSYNYLTGVPAEFRTVNPSEVCYLYGDPSFSCANVGAGTSCCTGAVTYGNNCGATLSGGPCYVG